MLQSSILYRVSDPEGVPLDRNNVPISESGERQAIALLEGSPNPDPTKYEVVATFTEGEVLHGVSTSKTDPICERTLLEISKNRIDVSNGPDELVLSSGENWAFLGSDFAEASPEEGPPGFNQNIVFSPTATEGQGLAYFESDSGQVVSVNIINLPGAPWILETGEWNNNGRWTPGGIWNY